MASTNSDPEKVLFPKSTVPVFNSTQFRTNGENYKYVSVERIISRYNTNYREHPVDPWDAIEWIYDTVKDIGSIEEYVPQKRELVVQNYMARIPCGVYKIDSVTASGCGNCPVRYVENGVFIQLYEPMTKVDIAFYGIPEDENGMPLVLEEYIPACIANIFINNQARADWYNGKIDNSRWQWLNNDYGIKCGDARGTFRYFSRNNSENYTRFIQKMVSTYKDVRELKF